MYNKRHVKLIARELRYGIDLWNRNPNMPPDTEADLARSIYDLFPHGTRAEDVILSAWSTGDDEVMAFATKVLALRNIHYKRLV